MEGTEVVISASEEIVPEEDGALSRHHGDVQVGEGSAASGADVTEIDERRGHPVIEEATHGVSQVHRNR